MQWGWYWKIKAVRSIQRASSQSEWSEPNTEGKLENLYGFKIDLENGTSSGTFDQPFQYVSSRMVHQISYPPILWETLIGGGFKHPTIISILERLAVSEDKCIEDMAYLVLIACMCLIAKREGRQVIESPAMG